MEAREQGYFGLLTHAAPEDIIAGTPPQVSHTHTHPLLETLFQSLSHCLCPFYKFLGFWFVSLNIHRFSSRVWQILPPSTKNVSVFQSRNAPIQDHKEENVDVLSLISLPNTLVFLRNGRYVPDHNRTHRTQHQRSSTQAPFPHTLLLVRTHDSTSRFELFRVRLIPNYGFELLELTRFTWVRFFSSVRPVFAE